MDIVTPKKSASKHRRKPFDTRLCALCIHKVKHSVEKGKKEMLSLTIDKIWHCGCFDVIDYSMEKQTFCKWVENYEK